MLNALNWVALVLSLIPLAGAFFMWKDDELSNEWTEWAAIGLFVFFATTAIINLI